jgi:hypothetical protein
MRRIPVEVCARIGKREKNKMEEMDENGQDSMHMVIGGTK